MNIGVVFQSELHAGGGFQYELTMAKVLQKTRYNTIFFTFSKSNEQILRYNGIEAVLIKKGIIDKLIRFINRTELGYWFAPKIRLVSKIEKEFMKYNIDLVYFLSPSGLALDLLRHNFIITVWDLCHLDHPEFPEVSFYREFERREKLYKGVLKKAVAVITDNMITKQKLMRHYGVNEERIYIVPFLPPSHIINDEISVDIKSKYSIDGEYIYYPAQFWPHKNHVYILDAIKLLKDEGIHLNVIFSGSDKGNLNYVMSYARTLGIAKQVKYIGFVSNEDVKALYKEALALVMPTYFGPTNLPPLEAFALGTPVIYSDTPDFRAQIGDAGLFCDLYDARSLAYHLKMLIYNRDLRETLIEKGKLKLKEILSNNKVEDTLESIFNLYSVKLSTWKHGK